MSVARGMIALSERGVVPDAVIRAGIRRLLDDRLATLRFADAGAHSHYIETFVQSMDDAPVAPLPRKANEQHYEVPPAFFERVLGPHRKYSACFWSPETTCLEEAERAALAITCERAGIANGMRVLELGCGWGSLTLWIAERYPDSRVVAVSNSAAQRTFILTEAARRRLDNVEVLTRDMNTFDAGDRFDRVVSVEMFEHMRNHRQLLRRIRGWLKPDGRFFMHVFCHRDTPYAFEDRGSGDWMSRHFFSGGMMPSDDLASRFQDDLRLVAQWRWNGMHYARTSNAWLANLDRERALVRPILEKTYGKDQAARWHQRWRMFFMACAELFAYDGGERWWVSHYLFEPRG